ncbi:hypothetical protein CAEBREN_04960 [Caenorhabditis brenneri]|uniref:Protein kinase domain-containing protein n=1 Tax=Caenorhabditis brenneri TaxID=135651 RepID=G0PM91_CAEBE|nr:hypothetical protein CAEBREN_04960 [Caenorhabditis brenneri]
MELVINPSQEVFNQLVYLSGTTHEWDHQPYDYKYYSENYDGFWFVAMIDTSKAPRMSQKYADAFGFTKMLPYSHMEAEIKPGKVKIPELPDVYTTKDWKDVDEHQLESFDLTICPRPRKSRMRSWFQQEGVYTRVAFDSAQKIVGYCAIRTIVFNKLCAAPFYAENEEVAVRLLADVIKDIPDFGQFEKLLFWYPAINENMKSLLTRFLPEDGFHIQVDFRTQFTKEILPARDDVVYSVASMELVINPSQEVFDQLIHLAGATNGWGHQPYDYKFYSENYGGYWFIAVIDKSKNSSENLVAGGSLARWDVKNGDPLYSIGLFYCKEEYRGKGYGKEVFKKIMDIVGDDNCVLSAAVNMSQKYADVFGFIKMPPYWHLKAELKPGKVNYPELNNEYTTKDWKDVDENQLEAYDLTVCGRPRKERMRSWFQQEEVYTRPTTSNQENITPAETTSQMSVDGKATESRKRAQNAESTSEPQRKTMKKIELVITPSPTGEAENKDDLDYGNGGYYPVKDGQVLNKRYEVQKMLGNGHFATVHMAEDRMTESTVAVKIAKSARRYEKPSEMEIKFMERIKEVTNSKSNSSSPGSNNIVKLLDDFRIKGKEGIHVVMVFEVLCMDLDKLLFESNQQVLTLDRIRKFSKNILEGLLFLHTKCKIMHLDIKPENCLVNVDPQNMDLSDPSCNASLKIGDFGTSALSAKEALKHPFFNYDCS